MVSILSKSLRFRIALPFLLFVVAGSWALLTWLERWTLEERRGAFEVLAETNGAFLRQQRIPLTERTEEALGRVLGMRVRFRSGFGSADGSDGGGLESRACAQPGRVCAGAGGGRGEEAVAVAVGEGVKMVLVRKTAGVDPRTGWVLLAFWLGSAATAWGVSRGVVLPLRQLVHRLPQIEAEGEEEVPGVERADEIGQLARAYRSTRAQLAEERKRRERSERMALLGRMATGLAHEIHNPLAAMRMHTELIQSASGPERSRVVEESVPVLLAENLRIEGLVNQWMFLVRPEPPRRSREDFVRVAGEQILACEAAARHAGVRVEWDASGCWMACMDARRMSQAVGNVLLNAIQAMSGGGVLRVSFTGREGWVSCLCRDSGPGFSAEALERHAELFYSEKEGGMGVGLNVTAEILAAHGGALLVRNLESGGAEVELRLPGEVEP